MSVHDVPGVEFFGKGCASYTLPSGYVDEKGIVHRELFIRELTGKEDDELDNDHLVISERVTRVLIACTEKLGTITDKAVISAAISDNLAAIGIAGLPLTSQDRIAAMLYVRRTSLGDIYKFEIRCPKCKKLNKNKQLDLTTVTITPPCDPTKRRAKVKLPKSGKIAIVKVLTAKSEESILLLPQNKEIKHYATLARVESLDSVKIDIILDHINFIRHLPRDDREFITQAYTIMEGNIDTGIQVTCKNPDCKIEFEFQLDLGQTFLHEGVSSAKGPRFMTFLPCGSRARLENDIICLMESYQLPYSDIMSMASSRRHRLIKMREMIIDQQKRGDGFSQPPITVNTGLGPSSPSRLAVPMGPSN